MAESLRSISERVDELPVVLAQRARMGVQPLLDAQFPTHGNWVGLSLGGVTVVWLPQIVSEADPRLHHGAPWTEPRLHTRRGYTGPPVPPLDMGDDRLAGGLEALSDEAGWALLERALNRQLLRVSDLQPEGVRRDSTTARGHGTVSEDGLCQCGHRKEHRPDLPQVQVRLSGLGNGPMPPWPRPPSSGCERAWDGGGGWMAGTVRGGRWRREPSSRRAA